MKIFCPDNFLPERKYIIDIILQDFLGLDYQIIFEKRKKYRILLKNNAEIIINDAFFSKFENKNTYLHKKNIPENIIFAKNSFLTEKNIPIIYGNSEIKIQKKIFFLGLDIFASAFFMLTRWEEFVATDKDKHQRFICKNSLAQKFDFHQRPVVDEYVEMFWNILKFNGCKQKRKAFEYQAIPTHDIDYLLYFYNYFDRIKAIAGDVFKRQDIFAAKQKIKDIFFTKRKRSQDPFDTYDYLMNLAEKYNLKAKFYFVATDGKDLDVNYNFFNRQTEKIIRKIKQRGHIIGIHGSYRSFNNQKIFKKEMSNFEHYEITVEQGRQHYLRFQNPTTWQIQNKNRLKYDSTIGFTNTSGFRAGTCREYAVFDIISQKRLNLTERPLIFMETASAKAYNNPIDFYNHLVDLRDKVKKYKGQFVFLWHNSNINNYYFLGKKEFIETLYQ